MKVLKMITELLSSQVLLDSAKEVFETMIFMDIAEVDGVDTEISGNAILGSITFSGEMEGVLGVYCDLDCARTIALNLLGMEPDDEIPLEDIRDAIGEVANIVMGSIKHRMDNDGSGVHVSIPTVILGQSLQESLSEKANKLSLRLCLEDEHTIDFNLLYRDAN